MEYFSKIQHLDLFILSLNSLWGNDNIIVTEQ